MAPKKSQVVVEIRSSKAPAATAHGEVTVIVLYDSTNRLCSADHLVYGAFVPSSFLPPPHLLAADG